MKIWFSVEHGKFALFDSHTIVATVERNSTTEDGKSNWRWSAWTPALPLKPAGGYADSFDDARVAAEAFLGHFCREYELDDC